MSYASMDTGIASFQSPQPVAVTRHATDDPLQLSLLSLDMSLPRELLNLFKEQ